MNLKMNIKKTIYDYVIIFVGCLLVSIPLQLLYLPHNMVTGGFSGLSIILTRYAEMAFGLNIPIYIINLILNVPLLIITLMLLGYKVLIKSFFATISISLQLYVLAFFQPVDVDIFIASIFGGVITGIGLGLVFSRLATTAGTDLVAMIFNKYFKQFNISLLLFFIDSGIILLGLFVFGIEPAMYAIVAVFVTSKLIDVVVEGPNFSKVAYIITDRYEELSQKIMDEMERGVTGLESHGMYTKKQRVTLMVVVPTKELPKLKDITDSIDPNAFMILSEAREVLGEGFKPFSS